MRLSEKTDTGSLSSSKKGMILNMLIHEDREIEEAAVSGGLCLCVPVSVRLDAGSDEAVITAYENVWDICTEYERAYGKDPFSPAAIDFLEKNVAPVIKKCGYGCDPRDHRTVAEYTVSEVTDEISTAAEDARLVKDASEITDLPCLCLHKPETDPDDEYGVCAVVIKDGAVCAVAGVNDFFTDDTVEINVETAKDYRRKGFGSAAVAALAEYLVGLGCTVGYKCGTDNKGSVGIAEKLGMTYTGTVFDMVCCAEE